MESVSLLPVIADLAGAAIARRLAGENYEVLGANRDVLDLSDQRLPKIGWSERALMRISWLRGFSVVSTPTTTILPLRRKQPCDHF